MMCIFHILRSDLHSLSMFRVQFPTQCIQSKLTMYSDEQAHNVLLAHLKKKVTKYLM